MNLEDEASDVISDEEEEIETKVDTDLSATGYCEFLLLQDSRYTSKIQFRAQHMKVRASVRAEFFKKFIK